MIYLPGVIARMLDPVMWIACILLVTYIKNPYSTLIKYSLLLGVTLTIFNHFMVMNMSYGAHEFKIYHLTSYLIATPIVASIIYFISSKLRKNSTQEKKDNGKWGN